jgi:hypothetical protein
MKRTIFFLLCSILSIGCVSDNLVTAPRGQTTTGDLKGALVEFGPKHIFLPRRGPVVGGRSTIQPLSPSTGNLTFHNGYVLIGGSYTYAIFWGTSWGTDPTFTADKITGLQTLFQGFGNSNYAGTMIEYNRVNQPPDIYTQPSDAYRYIPTQSTFGGYFVDNSSAPPSEPDVATVVGKVCSTLANNGVTPRPDALYSLYTTSVRPAPGAACAWHAYGACGATTVQVAWYPNLDNVVECSPNDYSNIHSNGLAALANVTAHELSETITDPRNGGWYATNGQGENGDKCAWTFPSSLVTLPNGAQFKLQGEWSNSAMNYRSGTPSSDTGEPGCVDGQSARHVLVRITGGPTKTIHLRQDCIWVATADFGTPPYSFQWNVQGTNFAPSYGTGSTFTTRTYSTQNPFWVNVYVTDAAGQGDSETLTYQSDTQEGFGTCPTG